MRAVLVNGCQHELPGLNVPVDTIFLTNKKPADKQKLRGGYYTPLKLTNFLVEWAIRSGKERVLEPSIGDGNFVVAALNYCCQIAKDCDQNQCSIVAVEIEKDEIQKAKNRIDPTTSP